MTTPALAAGGVAGLAAAPATDFATDAETAVGFGTLVSIGALLASGVVGRTMRKPQVVDGLFSLGAGTAAGTLGVWALNRNQF